MPAMLDSDGLDITVASEMVKTPLSSAAKDALKNKVQHHMHIRLPHLIAALGRTEPFARARRICPQDLLPRRAQHQTVKP